MYNISNKKMESVTNKLADFFADILESTESPEDLTSLRQNIDDITQNINHQIYQGRTAEEITATNRSMNDFMTIVTNRLSVKTETKLVSQNGFLIYKLANDKNICPSLKSWKWQDEQFLITHKVHDPINVLMTDKKESVRQLIQELHKMGLIHGNINKNNIVYNEHEGFKLDDFSQSQFVGSIDEQYLLNNFYGKSFNNVEELLNFELKLVDEIFGETPKAKLQVEGATPLLPEERVINLIFGNNKDKI